MTKKIVVQPKNIRATAKKLQKFLEPYVDKKKITLKELKAMLSYLTQTYALVTYENDILTVKTEGNVWRKRVKNNQQ